MDSSAISGVGTTTANIKGINLPLLAMPIKTNAKDIGKIGSPLLPNGSLSGLFKIKDDPNHKRKKKKKRKNFTDRIKDIEHNYMNDIRNYSYLTSYGPGAIGF